MTKRASLAGMGAALLMALAGPAAAKLAIAEAHVSGPGLGAEGLRISAHAAEGLWASGIDVAGGLDDARADSTADLGVTVEELGPKYVVTYEFGHTKTSETVRQNLYPYATGGPVTFTPPGQRVAEGLPWGGAMVAGWYQGPPAFLDYLVEQGLPDSSPVPDASAGRPGPLVSPAVQATPWAWIAVVAGAFVLAAFASRRVRRRLGSVAQRG